MHPRAEGNLLLFRIEKHACAIPIGGIAEIVQYAATTTLPGQPSILEGFLNLRGHALAVIRVAALFGLPQAPPALNSAIIVLRSQAGLLVDEVEGLHSLAPGLLKAVAEGHSFNGCAVSQFDFEHRRFTLLSPERILLAQEESRIAELAKLAQDRIAQLADTGA